MATTDPRRSDLPHLVSGIVDDARQIVQAEFVLVKEHVGERLERTEHGITSTLISGCIAVVAALMLGIALDESLTALGVPRVASAWIVTAIAIGAFVVFVRHARRAAREAAAAAAAEPSPLDAILTTHH